MQETTPEQVCFVAARQIGELQSTTQRGARPATTRTWPLITSADPAQWSTRELLRCRRQYWEIEAIYHRLDVTLGEDRSRVRSRGALIVLGMFRRLAVSFACAWLDDPLRRKRKLSTGDFLDHLRKEGARRAFALATSIQPTAWRAT